MYVENVNRKKSKLTKIKRLKRSVMNDKIVTNKIFDIATWTPWILYGFALLLSLFLVSKGFLFWPTYLRCLVLFMYGVQGLWAAIGHLLYPATTAAKIGWKPCEFQTEIGFANLAYGIVGIASFFYHELVVAVALMGVIFYTGCAYTHIKDIRINKNSASLNSGPMLYSTIITVVSIFVAFVFILL